MSVIDSLLVALFLMAVVFLVLLGLYLFIEFLSQIFAIAENVQKKKRRLRSQH
ncbi:MAG: OadG family protein [Eubacteriales bacterium]|nr:OadG family protein [Eubacteriales bacterium]